jgi:hypothetical protein
MTAWQQPLEPETCLTDSPRPSFPGRPYTRPVDVLKDASLDLAERRAILSAWASDACAVESSPTLRQPSFADRPVTFNEIMDALIELDRRVIARRRVKTCRDLPM